MLDKIGPWLFRARILALYVMIVLMCAGIAAAEDQPPVEPAPSEVPLTSPVVEAPRGGPTGISASVDESHDDLQRNILEQVIRLDSFFGNVTTEHQQKAAYQLRWRNSLRVEHDGQLKFGTTVRVNLQLSRINERLRLVIAGEDEPGQSSSSLPQDPGSPGFDRSSQSIRIANTELRYSLVQTPSLDIFIGAGVRLIIPPEAFVRGRFQYTHKISEVTLLRASETLFVKNLGRLGETSEIDLERLLNRSTLLRWANVGTFSDEIKGMEWGTELSLIRELSPRSGITLAAGVYGNSSNTDGVGNFRILARYRRNFLRSWLFYELEPEVSWPRQAGGSYPANFAFTFRIEVMFQGKEK